MEAAMVVTIDADKASDESLQLAITLIRIELARRAALANVSRQVEIEAVYGRRP
jgi:hypothetical protein